MDLDLAVLDRLALSDPGVRLGLAIIFAEFDGMEYDWRTETFVVKKSS